MSRWLDLFRGHVVGAHPSSGTVLRVAAENLPDDVGETPGSYRADPSGAGHRRAADYLALAAAGDPVAAGRLLAETTGLPAMTYLGAAFTAISRRGARRLSPAQRAQAAGRHMRITALRDGARRNPEALRSWLVAVAGEAAFVQQLNALADARSGPG